MARRSLKPQLNQIRAWVRQGRTDAWIAHQLDVSASELREFRKQHDLTPDDEEPGTGEVDLRDEIEAEVEAATAEEVEDDEDEEDEDEEPEEDEGDSGKAPSSSAGGKRGGRRGGRSSGGRKGERGGDRKEEDSGDSGKREDGEEEGEAEESEGGEGGGQRRRRRRRGRRGGRGRRREIEATFDHGERDGYGLWLDASVKDNPVYSEHWAGKREVTVRIEADQIVIRRAGSGENGNGDPSDD